MSDKEVVRVYLAAYRDAEHTELVGEGHPEVPADMSDEDIAKTFWHLIGVDPEDAPHLFYVINREPK